jgi:hypothetical protein
MVTSVQAKVSRLEEATGGDGGDECPRCGWGAGDDFGPDDTYEVKWVDPGGPDDREEFCEACSRQLVYVITWGDEVS